MQTFVIISLESPSVLLKTSSCSRILRVIGEKPYLARVRREIFNTKSCLLKELNSNEIKMSVLYLLVIFCTFDTNLSFLSLNEWKTWKYFF